MKKALVFGSVNIDYIYDVDHFVEAGETLSGLNMTITAGGKGQNQAIALARAGVHTYHAGRVGKDGIFLVDNMHENGVFCMTDKTAEHTGTAVIQRDKNGQNCILLYSGANHKIESQYINDVLGSFEQGDLVLLQNEINVNAEIIDRAYESKMTIIFNPSPCNEDIYRCDLSKVDMFFINEIEGKMLTGKTEPDEILNEMVRRYPDSRIILTLGGAGSRYAHKNTRISQSAYKSRVTDTTAAGDTFTGYFIGAVLRNMSIKTALDIASRAAAITVSRQGAAKSIPYWREIKV